MITKEEILRLACKMTGRSIAGGCYKKSGPHSVDIDGTIQDHFDAILHVAQKENIRIEDGTARKDPIYAPGVEAALAEKKRRIDADNEKPWAPF